MKRPTETNPWRTALVIPVRELYVSDSKGSKFVDTGSRVSLFMERDSLEILTGLPASSKDLFFYICRYLGSNTETIELNFDTYKQRTGMSKDTFNRAIKGLTNVLLIPKTTRKNTYFVNPAILYRGSRLTDLKSCISIEYQDPRVLGMRKLKILDELDPSYNISQKAVRFPDVGYWGTPESFKATNCDPTKVETTSTLCSGLRL